MIKEIIKKYLICMVLIFFNNFLLFGLSYNESFDNNRYRELFGTGGYIIDRLKDAAIVKVLGDPMPENFMGHNIILSTVFC